MFATTEGPFGLFKTVNPNSPPSNNQLHSPTWQGMAVYLTSLAVAMETHIPFYFSLQFFIELKVETKLDPVMT